MSVPRHVGRVALLVPNLSGGGGERVTLLLAGSLQRLGYEVDLVLGVDDGDLRDEIPDGVAVALLGVERMRWALPSLVAYIRRRRPDCLLPTLPRTNVLGMLAARVAGGSTRVVPRISNTESEVASRLGRASTGRLTLSAARRLYARAEVLIACSEGMADDILEHTPPRDRVVVLPNAVVGPDLSVLKREHVDDSWFCPGAPPTILAVGRLEPQKNFCLLVEAFAMVRAHRPLRLVILGEGPERATLEQHARDLGVASDVRLPGFDRNPYRYMSRAAVVALSSDFEGLPSVLIEALACGATVVSTDCPSGPAEILANGRYGRLCPVGEATPLAEALEQALDNPAVAPEEAWRPYETDTVALAYASLIDDL